MSERAIFAWKKKLRETGKLERVPLNRKYRKLDPEKLVKYVEDMGECSFEASSEFFDGIEVRRVGREIN